MEHPCELRAVPRDTSLGSSLGQSLSAVDQNDVLQAAARHAHSMHVPKSWTPAKRAAFVRELAEQLGVGGAL